MKKNKKVIFISLASTLSVFIAGALGLYLFTSNNKDTAALLTSDSNPYSLEYGVTLVNNGATSPQDVEEFNEEQYNTFIDNGLSGNKPSLEIFKLSNQKDSSEFVKNVSDNLGLSLIQEEITDGEVTTNFALLANSNGEEFVLSIVEEEYSNMTWEYSNSTAVGRNGRCPSLVEPSIYDFMIKTPEEIIESTPEGEEAVIFPDYLNMTEDELNDTFYMEAYNTALSGYGQECNNAGAPDFRELEERSKKFLNNFGLTELEAKVSLDEISGLFKSEVHQNISGNSGPKVATIFFDYGSNIVRAQGIYYSVETLGFLELLSPKESIIRTQQSNRILGEVNNSYTEGYTMINTVAPKNDSSTYALNRHENIYLTLSTIDGYLFVPGYLLYDNSTKDAIYTVAVPDEAFQNK